MLVKAVRADHENANYPVEPRIKDGRALLLHTHQRQTGDEKILHRHPEGQIWAVRKGLVTAELDGGSWVLPQGRIGWIPPGMPHAAKAERATSGWMAYLRSDLCDAFPPQPAVFESTALSQALLEKIAGWHIVQTLLSEPQERLLRVLIDELLASQAEPMYLPMPSHIGMRKMAIHMSETPGDQRSIAEWAIYAGISERSLTRHFRAETGMSLVAWRTVARMKRAIEMLTDGVSVTTTSFALGYDSVSSFITAFRHRFGVTPARYRERHKS